MSSRRSRFEGESTLCSNSRARSPTKLMPASTIIAVRSRLRDTLFGRIVFAQ